MKTLFYALLIGLIAMGCTDRTAEYNPQLPPVTETGANTFGAMINGKVMVPRTPVGYYTPPGSNKSGVRYTEDKTYCEISVTDGRTHRGYIYIYIKNEENSLPIKSGEYAIMNGKGELSNSSAVHTLITAFYGKDNDNNPIAYGSIENTGKIVVTRSDADIISGTFYCKLKNLEDPTDTIEITNGRFDFTKRTIYNTNFP